MIRAIANQKLNLSKQEYEYYLELEKAFGQDEIIGLFKTDDDGQITSVTPSPSKPTAMVLIFFFLNVMHNQRLRGLEVWIEKLKDIEERVSTLEQKIADNDRGN